MLLFFLSLLASAGPCGDGLDPRQIDADIVRAHMASQAAEANRNFRPNYEQDEKFFDGAWRTLKNLARENEVSVEDFLEDYFAQTELVLELEAKHFPDLQQNLRMAQSVTRKGISKLSELPEGKRPKREKHWQAVRAARLAIVGIAKPVYLTLRHRNLPIYFHPQRMTTAEDMIAFFDAAEMVSLDHVVDTVAHNLGRLDRLSEMQKMGAAHQPAANTVVFSDPEPEPAVAAPTVRTTDFVEGLRTGHFEADLAYSATNAFGQALSVTLERSVVRELEGADRTATLRLLRSITTGRGDTSGVKWLGAIGPGIVEIKARLHGHKRILGCLRGRHLVLRKLVNIPDNVAAYFRRIPADFCADL